MSFKVTARTILQLGAELISSDAIAFYELIKNAFDAKSKNVDVRVVVRIPHNIVIDCLQELNENRTNRNYVANRFAHIRKKLVDNINHELSDAQDFQNQIEKIDDADDLELLIRKSNYIVFNDQGDGMSSDDLRDIYLTIGTRHRV